MLTPFRVNSTTSVPSPRMRSTSPTPKTAVGSDAPWGTKVAVPSTPDMAGTNETCKVAALAPRSQSNPNGTVSQPYVTPQASSRL